MLSNEQRKLLQDVQKHLKQLDGWVDEKEDPQYPGYPSHNEANGQMLYRRIQRELDAAGPAEPTVPETDAPTATRLTVTDLYDVLADERHNGFGYATRRSLSETRLARLDRAVVGVANELGLDAEQLFQWADSKNGRWLVDAVYGNDKPATRATVCELLNRDVLQSLAEER